MAGEFTPGQEERLFRGLPHGGIDNLLILILARDSRRAQVDQMRTNAALRRLSQAL